MISKQDVQRIAKLARLGLAPSEVKKFQKELSEVLDYVNKLKEVETEGIEPTSHPHSNRNVMRPDMPESRKIGKGHCDERAAGNRKILEQVPEKKDGYVKVKSIL